MTPIKDPFLKPQGNATVVGFCNWLNTEDFVVIIKA